jgi:hypothetical protein
MDLWTSDEVHKHLDEPKLVKIIRLDGHSVRPAARVYIVGPPGVKEVLSLCLKAGTCSIRISDFGGAFFSAGQSVPKHLGTLVRVAMPEVMFLDPVGPKSGIWAPCCLFTEYSVGVSCLIVFRHARQGSCGNIARTWETSRPLVAEMGETIRLLRR